MAVSWCQQMSLAWEGGCCPRLLTVIVDLAHFRKISHAFVDIGQNLNQFSEAFVVSSSVRYPAGSTELKLSDELTARPELPISSANVCPFLPQPHLLETCNSKGALPSLLCSDHRQPVHSSLSHTQAAYRQSGKPQLHSRIPMGNTSPLQGFTHLQQFSSILFLVSGKKKW